jgi:DNA invertase Pin-like site-specific DNA recombinase
LVVSLGEVMRVVAYIYTDPLLESAPDPTTWGWDIDQVYQDRAIEASGNKLVKQPWEPRSQWLQLMADCQTMPTGWVLVRQLEELGESMQAVGDRLAQLESLKVELICLDQLPDDAEGLLGAIAPSERVPAETLKRLQDMQMAQRSRRIRQGHARNRVKALPPPGKAPYGYRRGKSGYVIDRSTAPVVKDFFEQFLLYGTVRGAVRYLAKRYSKRISVSTGQRWLANPVYRGDLEYQDGNRIRNTHDPILSRDEAAQIDRLLRRNRRLPRRSASAPRSLAGLVFCSECQSSMTIARVTTHRKDREYLYLRPTQCAQKPKCKAIDYDAVLQTTITRICEDLPKAIAGVELPDMVQIKQGIGGAIAAKQALLDQLAPLVEAGVLDQETADLRAYKVRSQMAELENQLAQLPPVDLKATVQTVSLPQFWLDLSETERRFYFREFIRQIDLIRQDKSWDLKLIFFFSPP